MNADEDYGFDVAGFLHVPQALSAAEVAASNEAVDAVGRDEGMLEWPAPHGEPFQALREHPVLSGCLGTLCGAGFAIDKPPALLHGEINRPRIGGVYQLPEPHFQPFRRMIGHPALVVDAGATADAPLTA